MACPEFGLWRRSLLCAGILAPSLNKYAQGKDVGTAVNAAGREIARHKFVAFGSDCHLLVYKILMRSAIPHEGSLSPSVGTESFGDLDPRILQCKTSSCISTPFLTA